MYKIHNSINTRLFKGSIKNKFKKSKMVKKSTSQGKAYVVEDILDTKKINGIQHFKVKWKGYNFSECTWEPESSFNCSK